MRQNFDLNYGVLEVSKAWGGGGVSGLSEEPLLIYTEVEAWVVSRLEDFKCNLRKEW